ncbi:MAG TPA: ATP-binding protein [Vicinamibacterales bacterium]|nr:ATP-binding protein [Vicinamibacterales bacterium]
MTRPVTVLMVEDSDDDAQLLKRELQRQGFEPDVTRVDTGPDLRSALIAKDWDIVISDHNMPGFSGDEALRLVKLFDPDLPFIVVSGTRGEEHAVDAMRAGASDFIVKARLHRLAPVVERELLASALRAEQRRIAIALEESQRQLQESQQLEAVGRLAGGVAHDFNNLVAAILSYADLILQSLPPGDAHRDDVEEIKRAGRHAADLTRQLVAFSRQQILDTSVIDLNDVIRDNIGLLQRLAGAKVEIETDLRPSLWHTKADRTQIEQVLMNLTANARDAMPEGGRLTIRTDNVVLPSMPAGPQVNVPGQYVRLDVIDTGTGIPEDIRSKIFDPFFTTKDIGKGTGLGLATVYGIVRQSGGMIQVESAPDKGAAFTIHLPRTTERPDRWPARRRAH